MRFSDTAIAGAFVVDIEPRKDQRGLFARTFCTRELAAFGVEFTIAQASVSWNPRSGTVRGMHYQTAPHEEMKLVRCTRGAAHDVIIDLRPSSPSFRRSFAVELRAEQHRSLLVPRGVAHGFQTLAPDTELLYFMDVPYEASAARGVRWNDPAFRVVWPLEISVISERDEAFPDFVT
jgi:dTDP-4-dehydrorhamnose 3,5-epimerase